MLGGTTYIIDFDSTLVSLESLDELANIALRDNPQRDTIMSKLEEITRLGMEGVISFDASLTQRLGLFRANSEHVSQTIELLSDSFTSSVLSNHEWFLAQTDNIYVVSGGFRDYIIPVVSRLGITPDRVVANEFVYGTDGSIIGANQDNVLSKAGGKCLAVRQLNLNGRIIAIGDGYTDYEIRKAGLAHEFWAFTEIIDRKGVSDSADRVIKSFDAISSSTQSANFSAGYELSA